MPSEFAPRSSELPRSGDGQGAEGGARARLVEEPARDRPSLTGTSTGAALPKRGARTRRRLLDAAEQVFAELGYHEASIVKITEAAGVAQGTFYLYFDSKQAIFDELVRT